MMAFVIAVVVAAAIFCYWIKICVRVCGCVVCLYLFMNVYIFAGRVAQHIL